MKAAVTSAIALCLLAMLALGQHPAQENSSPLIDGKLMYVGRMPANLDSWIVVDLRTWGKYKPTRDSEGVDLVMEAHEPETSVEYQMRRGIPQPKNVEKKHGHKPVMFSVIVTDWVTGRPVWQADILDRKPKKGSREMTTGSHSEIYARGLSTQQLAQEILRTLRSYVDHLPSEGGAAPALKPRS
jgi:hypothetical protein